MSFVATCHCGAVKVEVPRAPTEASRCNCTYCYRTGAVWTYYKAEELKVSSSVPLGDYAPSKVNHHHFCTTCGGNTHGISPDWHSAYNEDGSPKPGYVPGTVPEGRIGALNLNMAPEFDLGSITVRDVDGRNNW